MAGESWLYRDRDTVKTGSKNVGWALAAVIALLACCAVAPAVTSADASDAALLTHAPSTPIVTTGPWVVSGVPPAPRIGARAGRSDRVGPPPPPPPRPPPRVGSRGRGGGGGRPPRGESGRAGRPGHPQ